MQGAAGGDSKSSIPALSASLFLDRRPRARLSVADLEGSISPRTVLVAALSQVLGTLGERVLRSFVVIERSKECLYDLWDLDIHFFIDFLQ